MKKTVTLEEAKVAVDICYKQFVTRRDVQILISDLPVKLKKQVSDEIGKYCEDKIAESGKRLADGKYLPTIYVLEYLAPYGITKKSVEARYKYYSNIN